MKRCLSLVLVTIVVLAFTACAPATPQVIEKVVKETVIVEKQVPVEKEVVKTVEVEKVVKETVIVEKDPRQGGIAVFGYPGKTSYDHFCTLGRTTGGEEIWQRRIPAAKLFAYNEDYTEWVPDLAESWEMSADGMTITVHLRKGVKWHDGAPFTAEDVEFAFAMMTLPEVGNFALEFYDFLEGYKAAYENTEMAITPDFQTPGVVAVDDYTVQFKLSDKYSLDRVFLGLAQAVIPLPKHILAEYLESRDKAVTICQSDWALRNYVGLGPFKVVEYIPDEKIVYEAYEDYHLGRPLLDGIVYIPYADSQAMAAALENGELDMAYIPPTELERLSELPHLRIWQSMTPGTVTILWNCRDGFVTSNKLVRQALTYAIDREAFAEAFFGSEAAESFYPLAGYGGVPKDIKKYPYDPEKAKALLAEANWDPEHVLTFAVEAIPADPSQYEFIFDSFAKVGVKADFDVVGQGNLDAAKRQAALSFYGGPPHPTSLRHAFHCEGGVPEQSNQNGYCNPELVDEWGQVDILQDPEQVKEVWYDVQRTMAEDMPNSYLSTSLRSWGINRRLQGRLEPSLVYWQGNHWQLEKLWIEK